MKKVLVLALVCFAGLMIFACASGGSAAASPDKDQAVALFAEVKDLRAQFLKLGKDLTKEPYGRGESIYILSEIYMDKKMYTEALPGLGQCKKYYTDWLK